MRKKFRVYPEFSFCSSQSSNYVTLLTSLYHFDFLLAFAFTQNLG